MEDLLLTVHNREGEECSQQLVPDLLLSQLP